jgi:hypothetical protein
MIVNENGWGSAPLKSKEPTPTKKKDAQGADKK